MLYDPKWEVKTDPFTLESLIAWLETKNPTEKYNYHQSDECALAQWVKSIDASADALAGTHSFEYLVNGRMVDVTELKYVANDGLGEWTFGAALKRARALAMQELTP